MSAPSELSLDEILKFMLLHNGKVTNYDLVKHFRALLTDPARKDEARTIFKQHVNTLASIKTQNDEKWLILKRKYLVKNEDIGEASSQPDVSNDCPDTSTTTDKADTKVNEPVKNKDIGEVSSQPDVSNDCPDTSATTDKADTNLNESVAPPYVPPPAVEQPPKLKLQMLEVTSSTESLSQQPFELLTIPTSPMDFDEKRPIIRPRTKSNAARFERISSQSSIKASLSSQENIQNVKDDLPQSHSEGNIALNENEQTMSVKEKKQMFNRLASEGNSKQSRPNRRSIHGVDEEDRASVVSVEHKGDIEPMDPKHKEWVMRSARGEYSALSKMCSEHPQLVKFKDPFTTAMHWACKRGDERLVKLFAEIDRGLVHRRTGYTPLHIAMQFRRENVYKLLVDQYDANPETRDWSGRKARQYPVKTDALPEKKAEQKTPEPGGFLRMGSLNVRVKRTTEAFSNFLGVGASRYSAYIPRLARVEPRPRQEPPRLHKTWGSADSIPKEDQLMPPPSSSRVVRRDISGRQGIGTHSRSTPSTPDQPRHAPMSDEDSEGDSDSDTAAGFHAAWRSPRAS